MGPRFLTGSLSRSAREARSLTPFRLDSQLVNRAIREGGCESLVDQPVLLEKRQTVEARARDYDLKVVAPAGAILHGQLGCVRKRLLEQAPKQLHSHLSSRNSRAGGPGTREDPNG